MHTPAPIPTFDIFFVLTQVRRCFARHYELLRPLQARVDGAVLAGVDLYYREENDTALVSLRLDVRLCTRARMEMLLQVAERAGVPVLETAKLASEERNRFLSQHLPLYDTRVTDLPTPEDALRVLGFKVGITAFAPETAQDPRSAQRLEVRFRRGDDWLPGRARTISTDGIHIATGCPPRQGEEVEIELTVDGARLVTRAAVVQTTEGETAAAIGATGFGARFLLDPSERTTVNRFYAAMRELPPISRPPCRRDARYPVRWPVVVGLHGSRLSAAALDVSAHGMFVSADTVLPADRELRLMLPVDDEGIPLQASARIARAVPAAMARLRRIPMGLGLELGAMGPEDGRRFRLFVDRVARRAARTVVVGASAPRASDLVAELTAVGYTAAGAADAPSLLSRATGSRTPDLVLLDASLESGDVVAAGLIRRALASRQVAAVHVDEMAPRAARSLVDAALL